MHYFFLRMYQFVNLIKITFSDLFLFFQPNDDFPFTCIETSLDYILYADKHCQMKMKNLETAPALSSP